MAKKTIEPKRVPGDTFILCTFPLMYRGKPSVDTSANDLGELLAEIPNYIEDGVTLYVARVSYWIESSGGIDAEPGKWTTIMHIDADDLDAADEDEDEEASIKMKASDV